MISLMDLLNKRIINDSIRIRKLHKYKVFIGIIKQIMDYLDDKSLTVKSLDMGLWILGKYVFRGRKNVGDSYITNEFENKIGKLDEFINNCQ